MRRMFMLVVCVVLCGCTQQPQTDLAQIARVDALKAILSSTGEALIAKQDETITGLKDNTARLQTLIDKVESMQNGKDKSGKSADDIEQTNAPTEVVMVDNEKVVLYVTFAKDKRTCPPCLQMDKAIAQGQLAEFDIVMIDWQEAKFVPAIRFKDSSSITGWSVVYGWDANKPTWLKQRLLPKSLASVESSVRLSSPQQPLSMSWNINGNWNPSEDEIISHVSQDHGIDVAGMTLQEMLNAHDAAHSGRGTTTRVAKSNGYRTNSYQTRTTGRSGSLFNFGLFRSPVKYSSCPNCPSGRCP